ncbi:odorant receptor 13a-like isoform X1 [Cardiocondyla obscurior]|uniref:odorant receptor 13a-like isoform X1 n=1 Tax=Cardiocondyla obscurior TaxID=286306 RepID=UPI0039658CF4
MDLLPVNFCVLRLCGAWKEREDDGLIVRFISFCYRYAVIALIYYFTISELIELVLARNDVEALTEGLFLAISYITLCFKYFNFLTREHELRALLDCFRAKLCQPRDSAEMSILKQYDRKAKQTACLYMMMCQITGTLMITMPLLTKNERSLPCKTYIPYSVAAFLPYVLTYLQQSATVIYGILLNVSFDSLVYGFIIQACGQIELLCYRFTETIRFLKENNEEKKHQAVDSFAIADCVKHHISVYNITNRIESLFVWTTSTLFFFSLVTLCTSIFQMSKRDLFSPEFFTLLSYLGSMMSEVFIYCWYGNELDLKSKSVAQAIYTSDWTIISVEQRRTLLFVMMMSQRGRILSSYGFCSLILDTFTWVKIYS